MLHPLSGVRVVELGADLSAAYGARLLADLGAEVIKVERPDDGDPMRTGRPTPGDEDGARARALFGYLNHRKRSFAASLEGPDGADVMARLAEWADVIIVVAEGGAPPPPSWSARAVVVAVSARGLSGSGASTPSTPFVVQHSSGFAYHQACPVGDPERMPPTAGADIEGQLAAGVVVASAALWGHAAAGLGRDGPVIDVSLEDIYIYLLVEAFVDWRAGAADRSRRRDPSKGSTIAGGLVWLLPCRDGHVMVSPREDHQWQRWLDMMGRPDWGDDADLAGDREMRQRNAMAIQGKMSGWTRQRDCQDVYRLSQENRVACFPVSTIRNLLDNDQLLARRFFSELRLPDGRTLPVPGLPFRMESSSGEVLARADFVEVPVLGAATTEILAELGLADGGPAALSADSAVEHRS